jgi:hypothetical protein
LVDVYYYNVQYHVHVMKLNIPDRLN